ncbi:MAG: SusD/RagB family nutrient-binding outer membrane lipoprotein, partial [Flavobacterium sp.]|nr:SusD/RagB family nutrient-binding outer membrane lipoprotein [Flavobacterium sp.]MBP6074282.1 SusD/RagB family nutrient-binding outer membrane lipoprotein [Flavobacterium sp.]
STTPTPAYDDAKTIYIDLFARINAALTQLNSSDAAFTSADNIYGGDIAKWKKFANSLKLKLAMRVADVPAMATQSKAEAEAAIAAGVFTSNSDNATLSYESSTPNTNPIWVDLVQSGRSDFVAANTIINHMNTLNDPRRASFFDANLGAGVYTGGIYGASSPFANYTHIGETLHDPTFRGVLMDLSEVEFLLAEAKERNYTASGTAQSHYNAAITASMEDWGVSSAAIATYLASPNVAYTAPGTWRAKIGLQFWIAMYNRGFEGWSVYRKYDAPVLNIAAGSGLPVPKRYTYPVSEQTLNGVNYQSASSAIGGDLLTTKLFWDIN